MMIMALYLRLSKEDGDLVDESNSITNQRYRLRSYLEDIPELKHYQIKEYVDDGYSGKNFDRPGVIQLLEDVKSGKIYGIAVKDLSRFGRNHIEVGNYIEKIFPLLGVRFIAVNNHFDSADYLGTTPDMDVSFQNLMYDYFSEENSIKIKNDLFNKRMRGKYMATFAPYGYKKSEKDHNRLLPDRDAAEVVRLIFERYAGCGVKAEVARYLNDRNIPTPQEYAKRKGIAEHWKYEKEKKFWSGSIVGRILRNPVYIGNTVFHKKEVDEVGSRRTKCLPKEEWKVCENTHEAIISKELFERVNGGDFQPDRSAQTDVHDSAIYCEGERRKRGDKDSPIKGLVKCGGCKHNMNRRNRRNATYFCRHYYEVKAPECCKENVREDGLIRIIKDAIIRQAVLAADLKELLKQHNDMVKQQEHRLEEERVKIKNQLQKYKNENFALYERYKAGKIGNKEFQDQRLRNLKLQETCQKQIEQYEEKDLDMIGDCFGILSLLEGKENLPELTKETVKQLVSAIYVYGSDRVEIVFKFKDEMEGILGLINGNAIGYNKIKGGALL